MQKNKPLHSSKLAADQGAAAAAAPEEKEHLTKILASINELGLITPIKNTYSPGIRGVTKYDQPETLCFNLFNSNLNGLKDVARWLTVHEKEGLIAIASEQAPIAKPAQDVVNFSMHSVAFIFEAESVENRQPGDCLVKRQYQNPMIGPAQKKKVSTSRDLCPFSEVRIRRISDHAPAASIPANKLLAVLIPAHLFQHVVDAKLFPDALLIPVMAQSSYLHEWPLEFFMYSIPPIEPQKCPEIIHPNWALAIKQAIKTLNIYGKDLGIHLTRLPVTDPNIGKNTNLYNSIMRYGAFDIPFKNELIPHFRARGWSIIKNLKDDRCVAFAPTEDYKALLAELTILKKRPDAAPKCKASPARKI